MKSVLAWIKSLASAVATSQLALAIKNAANGVGLVLIFGVTALLNNQFVDFLKDRNSPGFIVIAFTFAEYSLVVLEVFLLIGTAAIHCYHYLKNQWKSGS